MSNIIALNLIGDEKEIDEKLKSIAESPSFSFKFNPTTSLGQAEAYYIINRTHLVNKQHARFLEKTLLIRGEGPNEEITFDFCARNLSSDEKYQLLKISHNTQNIEPYTVYKVPLYALGKGRKNKKILYNCLIHEH